jgi:redox-sensitive bicupin YhaK (pirin superfamily)
MNNMQIDLHKAAERGGVNLGWLYSNHSFSFGSYYNPDRMGFGKLRVLNDDVVAPSRGFDTHPHENMEIVSIPLSGELRHKDSMDNVAIIRSGEVQVMSAGTGVTHSEYNNSDQQDAKFLQIWVQPNVLNESPCYQQKDFSQSAVEGEWQLLVSPDGEDGSLKIKQNARFSMLSSKEAGDYSYRLADDSNGVFVFVISGSVQIAGQKLSERDGVAVQNADSVDLAVSENAKVLVIEVAL